MVLLLLAPVAFMAHVQIGLEAFSSISAVCFSLSVIYLLIFIQFGAIIPFF